MPVEMATILYLLVVKPKIDTMKTLIFHRASLRLIMLLYVVSSCIETNEELTIDQFPNKPEWIIDNNSSNLNSRMKIYNQQVSIVNTSNGRVTNEHNLKLLYGIESPFVDGEQVMATALDIRDNIVAVSYNFSGDSFKGGVDLLELDDDKMEITSQVSLLHSDVSMVRFNKDFLFVAGGSPTSDSTAFLDVMEVKNGKIVENTYTRILMGGYVATSVKDESKYIFITSGNSTINGGGLHVIDNKGLELIKYIPVKDARWLESHGNQIIVLSANPGTVTIVDKNSLEIVSSFSASGLDHSESKSSFDIDGKSLYVASGYEGVNVYDINSGRKIGNIPLPDEADSMNMFANSVTIEAGMGFIAAGEAVFMFNAIISSRPRFIVEGRLDLGDFESINHVAFRKDHLFVASGLGGTRLIKIDD